MFRKDQRGGFAYTIAHTLAYNACALSLGVWKFKYIFHDWEKPWLMLWAKLTKKPDPYKWVQHWHRHHRKHHLEYYRPASFSKKAREINVREMIIDWECSRYTKEASQFNAFDHFNICRDKLPNHLQFKIITELEKLGIYGSY